MKKIQNYLTKPEQLRKKLENPGFRHDFMQWSKSHLCQYPNNRKSACSKSPHERSRSQLACSSSKTNHNLSYNSHLNHSHNRSKQNLTPNYLNHGKSTHSLSKKNMKSATYNDSLKPQKSNPKIRKPLPSEPKTHSHLRTTQYKAHEHPYSSKTNCNSVRRYQSQHHKQEKSLLKASSDLANYNSLKNKRKTEKMEKERQKEKRQIQFKYSFRTRQGVLATNPKKTNQDRILIKTNIQNSRKNVFAVADGHGANGHFVAETIVTNMDSLLESEYKVESSDQKKQPQKKSMQPEILLPNIYNKLQKILSETTEFNAQYSGSTLVTVMLEDQYITCANVGDSRAILARQVDKKSWEVIYLSQDQKPCVEAEKKRILKYGGRIQALIDERGQSVGPLRVWLPNQNVQGLAMSRSLGDNISKPYGVTHKPEIIKICTDKRDRFILIASDGVWQFLNNQEVLQLIVPYYRQKKLEQACDAVLKLAYDRWTVEDTSVVDDISFVLIFL